MAFDRELIEAKLALDLIASADMPSVAVEGLEAGLDGPAIRRLAVLERPTYFEIREVLPRAMAELGIAQITTGEAALRVARRLAEEILESGDDPLKHSRDFQSLWTRAKYAKEIRTLGTLYDDVWIAESAGQSEAKVRKWVTGTLREFANRRKAL